MKNLFVILFSIFSLNLYSQRIGFSHGYYSVRTVRIVGWVPSYSHGYVHQTQKVKNKRCKTNITNIYVINQSNGTTTYNSSDYPQVQDVDLSKAKWTIWFRCDRTEFYHDSDRSNETNLQNVVNVYYNNPNCIIHLFGYASKNTGSESRNRVLAKDRNFSVKNELLKMGVDANRIKMDTVGIQDQPYNKHNDANQCVIITIEN